VLSVFQQTSIGQVLIGQPLDNCNTRFGATSPVHYGYSHVLTATARMAQCLLEFAIRPRSPSQCCGDSIALLPSVPTLAHAYRARASCCKVRGELLILHASSGLIVLPRQTVGGLPLRPGDVTADAALNSRDVCSRCFCYAAARAWMLALRSRAASESALFFNAARFNAAAIAIGKARRKAVSTLRSTAAVLAAAVAAAAVAMSPPRVATHEDGEASGTESPRATASGALVPVHDAY
jgi:hypothetical protein